MDPFRQPLAPFRPSATWHLVRSDRLETNDVPNVMTEPPIRPDPATPQTTTFLKTIATFATVIPEVPERVFDPT